MLKLKGST